jgi:hypothetical protein
VSAVATGSVFSFHNCASAYIDYTQQLVFSVKDYREKVALGSLLFILSVELRSTNKSMTHQRSPNCPKISFLAAAEKGRILYAKENTHPAARQIVVQSLGYSGINGASLSTIGALRQYGILEGNGDALRITDDAVAYFELEDGPERSEAVSRMLFHPPFFAQIHADFGDTLPSESNLKHYLIKRGFLPKAAEEVIQVYRENIRLSENTPQRCIENIEVQKERMSTSTGGLGAQGSVIDLVSLSSPGWSQSYSFGLSKGSTAELHIKGDVTKEALLRLKAYIDVTIGALSEDIIEKNQ